MTQQTDTDILLTVSSLQKNYSKGSLTPVQVIKTIIAKLKQRGDDGIWTCTLSEETLSERAVALTNMSASQRSQLPLWGIPFSVKDCIDVAGIPTSAACPAFAYNATHTNPVVQKLLDAGAILIGKTNLDQFATGLVGIRTGYIAPHNAFSKDYIPGGSSSGAALSVAHGLVSFAIGTDTGGSGRVPAGFNNIVGLKPTRGLLSTRHTVEACRTLDCLSIFSLTATDAQTVLAVAQGYDPDNPFSRPAGASPASLSSYQTRQPFRFGVPRPNQREFFGNGDIETCYSNAIKILTDLGGVCIEIDFEPFLQANNLLFNGPWVAERYASVGTFVEANPDRVFPTTRKIILNAKNLSASQAFEGIYAMETLKQKIKPLWQEIDCLMVPTTGTVYRIEEVEKEPLALNANLGYYTNFVNLLDLSAIAIPNGFQSNGIPTGITFIAPPYSENYLVGLGSVFHHGSNHQLGATAFKVGS
ncbi:allophanate hydrolase [Leptolyngbya cf. ectocarpi LEGE 11479]|uniref:Allophanate hydrolase n=1 Tax=Leptolyngbya cf. ectocarpi LEGE 11479 TaxID=1828722 RepID=A0A928ZSJ2_LEPEC|nr:allophanate hydrolase [Leptolyngbya ectocarpi]MBE9065276.1 allophanate hydrolase [Leptolyngbya cf. ectocarpi LEGE 11479]